MIEIASANTNSQTSNAKKYAYITTNSKSYKVTINVKGTDGKPITIS